MILCSRDGCFFFNLLKRHNPLAWTRGSWRSFSLNFSDSHRDWRFKQPPWERIKSFFAPTPMSLWRVCSSWIYGNWVTWKILERLMVTSSMEDTPRKEFHHPMKSMGWIPQESQLGHSCSGSGSSTWPCSTLWLQGLVASELTLGGL